jgi:pyridoxine/pyridoxamine 5'-phosphate oxidase
MAREAGIDAEKDTLCRYEGWLEPLKAFEALVRADEREQIEDEWSMCVQSDLEHGVKSLNEQAAKDWFKKYPEIAKFGAWLSARGNT